MRTARGCADADGVKRIALIAALGLAACAAALPALADDGPPVKGVVAGLSASGVSVSDGHHTLSCALAGRSPSLAGYAVGDRVQAQCRRTGGHLVLVRIRHLSAAPAAGAGSAEPVSFGGTVTALSATSVSLHDGNRDLTCAIDGTSPSTSGLAVGAHAKVVCRNGVLTAWVSATAPAPPAPVPTPAPAPNPPDPSPAPTPSPSPQNFTTAAGTLTALSSTSVTVHSSEHGDVSCSVTDASPHLGDYHLGDHVKMACADAVLKLIAKF